MNGEADDFVHRDLADNKHRRHGGEVFKEVGQGLERSGSDEDGPELVSRQIDDAPKHTATLDDEQLAAEEAGGRADDAVVVESWVVERVDGDHAGRRVREVSSANHSSTTRSS